MKQFFASSLLLFIILFAIFPSKVKAQDISKNFLLTPSNPYVDSGIDIQKGGYVLIRDSASGSIYVPGSTIPWIWLLGDPGCAASSEYTVPDINCWSLVARIGNGKPFLAANSSNSYSFYAPKTGRLYLGINHALPFSGSGFWNINVVVNQTPPLLPPLPFLELPWATANFYQSAMTINSYFDHEYPLLSIGELLEPSYAGGIITYKGEKSYKKYYSSHDGYDWGRDAGAKLNEPVLAAASGCALYRKNYYYGNGIFIDHGNFYQTRYYHLQPEELITLSTTNCVEVSQGQQIGKVGSTGENSTGPHLHFMVVKDKNHDGNFDDNIPDGVTDPFGWQSEEEDPWPLYNFTYTGVSRVGTDSHYLWETFIPELKEELPANGGIFTLEKIQLLFPANATREPAVLYLEQTPLYKISDTIVSVGSAISATAKNLFGTIISQFEQFFTMTIDFSEENLDLVDPETLSIYSSSDGNEWKKEETFLDLENKLATASLNHFTHFVLAGEKKDTASPSTALFINDQLFESTESATFSSPVKISLEADDATGSGIYYTTYLLNNLSANIASESSQSAQWLEYKEPIVATQSGEYSLHFYSEDNAENIEPLHSNIFTLAIESPLPTPEPSIIPSPSGDPSPEPTVSPSSSPSISPEPSISPSTSPTIEPSPTPSLEPSISPSPTLSPSATPSPSSSPSPSLPIDQTPPEIQFSYDPISDEVRFNVIDESSVTLELDNFSFRRERFFLVDAFGNSTEIIVRDRAISAPARFSIESVRYNNGLPNSISQNVFTVVPLINTKTQELRRLTQNWRLSNILSVQAYYDQVANATTLSVKNNFGTSLQTIPGMILLKIATHNGEVLWNY